MKYSVWDFSQVKMAEYNASHPGLELDPTDVFIFTWFKGFSGRTKANHSSKETAEKSRMWTKEINGTDYFLVRYDAIIKDFPLLGYTDTKSIQRRFNKYVSGGIMDKQIVYNGRNGNYAYFAFTDLFWSFEYDRENPEQKKNEINVNENKKTTKENETIKQFKIEKVYKSTEKPAEAENQETNTAEEITIASQWKATGVSPDNSVQTKGVSPDNSVQTKGVSPDNSVQTKGVSPDNSVQTLINNPTTSLNNPTTTSLNPSISQSFPEKDSMSENKTECKGESEEEVFNKTINKLFGYMPVFTKDFLPELLKAFSTAGLTTDRLPEYLEFIYPVLQKNCKNINHFTSYFYSSAKIVDNIKLFISEKRKTDLLQQKNEKIICPICGTKHKQSDYTCPVCMLYHDSLEKPEDIKYFKAIYNLKNRPENKELFQDYVKAKDRLDEEYPVSKRLSNRAIAEEYSKKAHEIDEQYLSKVINPNEEKTA